MFEMLGSAQVVRKLNVASWYISVSCSGDTEMEQMVKQWDMVRVSIELPM